MGASAASALTVTIDSTTSPYPGVTLHVGHTTGPTRNFRAVEIDLCTDYVHVAATAAPTKRQTVGAWASGVGAQVGVNGDFFHYTTPPKVYGDAVGAGVQWPAALNGADDTSGWYKQNYGWIAVGPAWVEFTHTEHVKNNALAFEAAGYSVSKGWKPTTVAPQPPPGTLALVSGFSALVIEGKLYTCPDAAKPAKCFPDRGDMSEAHKRTAMGFTKDRKTLIFVIMTSSTYGEELAEVIYELGAWQAFNIDGGGSSTLWTESAGYLFPSGTKRAVANHWGIFAGAGSGKPEAAGHCFVTGGCFPTPIVGAEDAKFADFLPTWFHYSAAVALLDEGITNGCGQTDAGTPMFCPKCDISRREFAVFLVKGAGLDVSSPPAQATFVDVPTTDWAYAYIEAMAAAGITNGCGNDKFCPDKTITRAQAAKFLRKAVGWNQVTPAAATFADVPTDHLFFGDVEAIAANCVTNGCGDGNFCPSNPITRAQAATFLVRTFDIQNMNSCLDYCDCSDGSCDEWTLASDCPEPEPEPAPDEGPAPDTSIPDEGPTPDTSTPDDPPPDTSTSDGGDAEAATELPSTPDGSASSPEPEGAGGAEADDTGAAGAEPPGDVGFVPDYGGGAVSGVDARDGGCSAGAPTSGPWVVWWALIALWFRRVPTPGRSVSLSWPARALTVTIRVRRGARRRAPRSSAPSRR